MKLNGCKKVGESGMGPVLLVPALSMLRQEDHLTPGGEAQSLFLRLHLKNGKWRKIKKKKKSGRKNHDWNLNHVTELIIQK
jgi:hypothetical protein